MSVDQSSGSVTGMLSPPGHQDLQQQHQQLQRQDQQLQPQVQPPTQRHSDDHILNINESTTETNDSTSTDNTECSDLSYKSAIESIGAIVDQNINGNDVETTDENPEHFVIETTAAANPLESTEVTDTRDPSMPSTDVIEVADLDLIVPEDDSNPDLGSRRSGPIQELLTKDNFDNMLTVSKGTNEIVIDLDYEIDDGVKSLIFRESPFNEIYNKMVKVEKLKCMDHPVVESVLVAKWSSIQRAYVANIAFYILFLGLLTWHFQKSTNNQEDQSYYILTSNNLDDHDCFWKLFRIILVAIYIIFLGIFEIIQICTLKCQYLSSGNLLENIADWSVILATFSFIMAFLLQLYDVSVIALSIAMLFGWVNLCSYLAGFPMVGTVLHVTSRVGLTLLINSCIFSPILIGFTCFFRWALGSNNQMSDDDDSLKQFRTFWGTFMKLFAMLTGDITIEKFSQEEITIGVDPNIIDFPPFLVKMAAVGFIFIMCVVVGCMLISLTISRTSYFMKKADTIRLIKTAYVCKSFESMSGKHECFQCLIRLANCYKKCKTNRISKIHINLDPKNYFFNNFLLQFVYVHHGDIYEETSLYLATVTYKDETQTETCYLPAWVIAKALEIVNKREETKAQEKRKETEALNAAQIVANAKCNGRCRLNSS